MNHVFLHFVTYKLFTTKSCRTQSGTYHAKVGSCFLPGTQTQTHPNTNTHTQIQTHTPKNKHTQMARHAPYTHVRQRHGLRRPLTSQPRNRTSPKEPPCSRSRPCKVQTTRSFERHHVGLDRACLRRSRLVSALCCFAAATAGAARKALSRRAVVPRSKPASDSSSLSDL